MRRLLLAALTAMTLAAAAAAAAAAGGPPDSATPRPSSVGDGLGGPPPIARKLRRAAAGAGCAVRSFRSAGRDHGRRPFHFAQTPAVSGTHHPRWADWGIYESPVPAQYQVHNLEHGGVIVHLPATADPAVHDDLQRFARREPGYLLLVPPASPRLRPAEPGVRAFPPEGLVVTSWQRRMVCPRATTRALAVVRGYVRRYRGTGPERIAPVNAGGPRPAGLPAPVVPAP